MRTSARRWIKGAVLAASIAWPAAAAIAVLGQFADGLVLQREQPVRLSGTAPASSRLRLALGGHDAVVSSDSAGQWRCRLPPLPAGGPYTLTVTDETGARLVVDDILCGDLWLWAGDLQTPLHPAEKDFQNNHPIGPDVRIFRSLATAGGALAGPLRRALGPGWQRLDMCPQADAEMLDFAAAMRQLTGIPLGLIVCQAAESPIASWISADGLRRGRRRQELDDLDAARRHDPLLEERQQRRQEDWEAEALASCLGKNGLDTAPADEPSDDRRWSPCQVPEKNGAGGAAITWYRRRITIPAGWRGHRLRLRLGHIGVSHQIYFNGELVSAARPHGPGHAPAPSHCLIPPEHVRAGQNNLLAVRLIDFSGLGCLAGPANEYFISPEGEEQVRLSLSGTWRRQQLCQIPLAAVPPRPRPVADPGATAFPTALFNTLIAPWTNHPLRGIIWQHGAGQTGQCQDYVQGLPLLIRDWRRAWGDAELPFVVVQLGAAPADPAIDPWQDEEPPEHPWASLREVQAAVAAEMPATGLCLALAIDRQPSPNGLNLPSFGRRLAAEAGRLGRLHFGTTSGPLFHHLEVRDDSIRLAFRQTGGGLATADGAAPAGFSVAGRDDRYFPAEATLEGDVVVVRSDRVPRPLTARYGWAGDPQRCNLCNREGYPAVPFRSQPPDYLKIP